MWKRVTDPDVLIFLRASFSTCTTRRDLRWLEKDYLEQMRRLAHALAHADVIIETDELSAAQVFQQASQYLKQVR